MLINLLITVALNNPEHVHTFQWKYFEKRQKTLTNSEDRNVKIAELFIVSNFRKPLFSFHEMQMIRSDLQESFCKSKSGKSRNFQQWIFCSDTDDVLFPVYLQLVWPWPAAFRWSWRGYPFTDLYTGNGFQCHLAYIFFEREITYVLLFIFVKVWVLSISVVSFYRFYPHFQWH